MSEIEKMYENAGVEKSKCWDDCTTCTRTSCDKTISYIKADYQPLARPNSRRKATSERNFGMSKYIIKNCPVAFNTRVDGTYCNDVEITIGKNTHCQYITDCIIKQIVEKCKNAQLLPVKNRQDLYAVKVFANDILQLLNIQEVE